MFTKADEALILAQCKAKAFLESERGEVNIVTTVVLIGIAVTLAVLFKGQITNLLNNLMNTITNTATNAIK